MRDPRRAVARSQGWQDWGKRAAKAMDDALAEHPESISLVEKLGAEISSGDSDAASATLARVGTAVAKSLAKQLGQEGIEEDIGPTGWRWKLIKEITSAAGDKDLDISEWLKGLTPLGIDRRIPSRGGCSRHQMSPRRSKSQQNTCPPEARIERSHETTGPFTRTRMNPVRN